jgi:hypothetical protein
MEPHGTERGFRAVEGEAERYLCFNDHIELANVPPLADPQVGLLLVRGFRFVTQKRNELWEVERL